MEKAQKIQEDRYLLPYHYLDLESEEHKYLLYIEYLSRLRYVKKLLAPYKGQKVLDVGCGDGRFCFELGDVDVELFGADYSERAIAFARLLNTKATFFSDNISKLVKLYKASFDQIVCIETLEHIPPSEISGFISCLSSLIRENGTLILTVPSDLMPIESKHYQHFNPESLTAQLSSHLDINSINGFSVKKGWHSLIFKGLYKIGRLALPFKRFSVVKRFYAFLYFYFNNHLLIGKPCNCAGLIATCSQKVPE
jgi:2-polyprenyl-3-methyl-5-hydroxy-6-metoxy-1,4-benzoquinol methylase